VELVEVYDKAEHVDVQRSEDQIQYRARRSWRSIDEPPQRN